MTRVSVFIDEAGTLPDPKDKVIVVAAVVPQHANTMEKITKDLQKLGKQKRQKGELKFYTAGYKTKIGVFETLTKYPINIFVLVVEKMGRKIPDTPEHFGLLCWLLLRNVLTFYPITDIVFDRHFFRKADLLEFNSVVTELLEITFEIHHVDSAGNKKVNIADMVAGAVLAKESEKDKTFYNMIEKKITSYNKLNWVEAKARLFKR